MKNHKFEISSITLGIWLIGWLLVGILLAHLSSDSVFNWEIFNKFFTISITPGLFVSMTSIKIDENKK